jgi:hypothetical protein
MFTDLIKLIKPATNNKTVTLDPSMLPIAIPKFPDITELIEMVVSGITVAMERNKKPTVSSPSLVIFAIFTEDFITVWLAFESTIIETINIANSVNNIKLPTEFYFFVH